MTSVTTRVHPFGTGVSSGAVRLGLDAAFFLAILAVALSRLAEPFFGDQAVGVLMAHVIASGGAPYAELWHPGHPGIFFFFALGGALFGFSEVAIHALELLWMLALAVCTRMVAARLVRRPVIASLAPALTVFGYYAGTTSYHVTQVEGLIALPLLVSLAALAVAMRPRCERRATWLFVSGVSAGIVAVFSTAYVVLPVVFWCVAAAQGRRVPGGRPVGGHFWRRLLSGMVIAPVITMVYLLSAAGPAAVWWTFVRYPFEAATQCPLHADRLADGIVWFARTFRVHLALMVIGLWSRRREARDLLSTGLIIWAAAAVPLIALQVLTWWSYQFLLLLVPVGLLALQGLETLWSAATNAAPPRRLRAAAVVALFGLGALYLRQVELVSESRVAALMALPSFATREPVEKYQRERYPGHARQAEQAAFLLAPDSYPGPIYAFAMPDVYVTADRRPAIPYLAAWFRPTATLWARLIADLEAAAPPYILVDEHELEFIAYQNPVLQEDLARLPSRLERRYRRIGEPPVGTTRTWYIRRDLPAGGPERSLAGDRRRPARSSPRS